MTQRPLTAPPPPERAERARARGRAHWRFFRSPPFRAPARGTGGAGLGRRRHGARPRGSVRANRRRGRRRSRGTEAPAEPLLVALPRVNVSRPLLRARAAPFRSLRRVPISSPSSSFRLRRRGARSLLPARLACSFSRAPVFRATSPYKPSLSFEFAQTQSFVPAAQRMNSISRAAAAVAVLAAMCISLVINWTSFDIMHHAGALPRAASQMTGVGHKILFNLIYEDS